MLIFDLDDTLVYTHKTAYEKTLVTARTFDKSLSFQDFKKVYSKKDFISCVRFWFDDVDPEEFRKRYDLIRRDYPYEPIGDVSRLLNKLAQSNNIGILTNSTSEGTEFKLDCLGFTKDNRDVFDFIYHKDNSIAPKPNPAQIREIASKGFSLNEMVYIGDSVRDWKFALLGGISFYAVLTGIETKQDFLFSGLDKKRIIPNIHSLIYKL